MAGTMNARVDVAAGDASTTDSCNQSCEYPADGKASKKKLKKERQRIKKNESKSIKSEAPEPIVVPVVDDVEKIEKITSNENQNVDNDTIVANESNSDNDNSNDNDNLDLNFSTAFIQSIINKGNNHKKHAIIDHGKNKQRKDSSHESKKNFTANADGFTPVKKASRPAPNASSTKAQRNVGIEALRVIKRGNFQAAIEYLTKGIQLDPSNTRHYINRSYCYLRQGQYDRALADVQLMTPHLKNIQDISSAKCREGLALCGLEDFEAAESAIIESLNLVPNSMMAKRELLCVQMKQLAALGFNERDALMALQQTSNTRDAVYLLSEQSLTQMDSFENSRNKNANDDYIVDDDEIFLSDTEDDPSNERLKSKMLNYDPNMPEYYFIPDAVIPTQRGLPELIPLQERALRVIKAVPVVEKPKNKKSVFNDKAVWVGSLTSYITDKVLQTLFGRFGRVKGADKPTSETWGFVHFASSEPVIKILEQANRNGGYIDFDGEQLLVKPATMKGAQL